MTEMKKLRIFTASSTDMTAERTLIGTVAWTLKPLADALGITVDVLNWNEVLPGMGRAQKVILDHLQPKSWDVFIGILWHRFGSPTAGKDPETDKNYMGGTEEEFKIAYRLWRQYGRPRIMVYRCKRNMPVSLDPDQYKRVLNFFDQFEAVQGEHPGLYQWFDTTESFEKLLFDNLQKILLESGETFDAKLVSPELIEALRSRIPDNLPRRAPFFGREKEMKRALRALSPEDRTWGVLLDGIGGIGKTTLAIEAAYRSREMALFDAFIFVTAKQRLLNPGGIVELPVVARTIDEFIEATASVLRDGSVGDLPTNDKRGALLSMLRGRRALLIYDNLETLTEAEQNALADFLRQLPPGCKAIVTSRRRGGEGAVWIHLEKLERAAMLSITKSEIANDPQLAGKMTHVSEERWRELHDEVKGSPLALMYILGLIRVKASATLETVLKQLREHSDSDLQKFIFREAERELSERDKTALRALSFFSESASFEAWMQVADLSRTSLELAIDHLSALSLVDVMWSEQLYALHPLTRTFVRSQLFADPKAVVQMEERFAELLRTSTQQNREVRSRSLLRIRQLPHTLTPLEAIAENYWWSWAPDGAEVFRDLEPTLWQQSEHNPRILLSQVLDYRLAEMAAEPSFTDRVDRLSDRFKRYLSDARLSPQLRLSDRVTRKNPVAYFCAEFGIHSSLHLYSGGLGILAGDHLKSASDLNLPTVAVGLFYRFGYFRQRLRRDGWQEETYRENHADELALDSVRDSESLPVIIDVAMRGRVVHARAWRANVGRAQLYLLDTNVAENAPVDQLITGHLYGGDRETRLVQEMMLGIGGVRLLRRLNIQPGIFHLNEGHSALLTLELASQEMERSHVDFEEAAGRVRESCVFTTHTPVAAGHDEFDPALVEKCLGDWPTTALGLATDEFLKLGRINGDSQEPFGLTPLALRMCRSTNGVSRKHGEVSRELWHKLWPERPVSEVPITSVTNGVHLETWVAPVIRRLYEQRIGEDWVQRARFPGSWIYSLDRQHEPDKAKWEDISRISDFELWQAHSLLKQRLVAFIRDHSFDMRLARGESEDYIEAARTMFDPRILTIGFARRVAGYKRWDLLLSEPDLLTRLINDPERPIQFVFAGKAHPQDQGAKLILQKLIEWQRDSSIRQRVAFIEDYDQEIARQLVQSVDVWMNLPRRPMEASGTSGEKVAINGGLNFSVLDGWWVEGYDGDNGFAIGDLTELTDTEADRKEAESLYRILQEEVAARFYERDSDDIPRRWIAMMKRSIQTLVPLFSSDRMVAEYAERIY